MADFISPPKYFHFDRLTILSTHVRLIYPPINIKLFSESLSIFETQLKEDDNYNVS